MPWQYHTINNINMKSSATCPRSGIQNFPKPLGPQDGPAVCTNGTVRIRSFQHAKVTQVYLDLNDINSARIDLQVCEFECYTTCDDVNGRKLPDRALALGYMLRVQVFSKLRAEVGATHLGFYYYYKKLSNNLIYHRQSWMRGFRHVYFYSGTSGLSV